jgi:hypothetical protein
LVLKKGPGTLKDTPSTGSAACVEHARHAGYL